MELKLFRMQLLMVQRLQGMQPQMVQMQSQALLQMVLILQLMWLLMVLMWQPMLLQMVLIKFKMLERQLLIKLKLLEIRLEELGQILETIQVKQLILHLVHKDLFKIFNRISLRNFNTKKRNIQSIFKNNRERIKNNLLNLLLPYLKNRVINVEIKTNTTEINTSDRIKEENIIKTNNKDTKTLKLNNSYKKFVTKSKTK